jgi:hemin uptake protein HemP
MSMSMRVASVNANNYYLSPLSIRSITDMSTTESNPARRDPSMVPPPPRRLTSEELIGPQNHELLIRHAGSDYRLRITRQGKLILTK